MKPITAIVLGAGSRGSTYARYAKDFPGELQIIAVAEPREDRRKLLAEELGVPEENRFASWQALLAKQRMADCAFVCTLDDDHTEPAIRAMELGYHLLLEKPMSNTEKECRLIADTARKTGRTLAVCHVLRYTPFYMTLKKLIDRGAVGQVEAINQIENVGYWHQAHSFVRGNWRTVRETSPMLLQKSCHDMDIILWLMGRDCKRVQSFGSLRHFTPEHAPQGAPERCLDGCPHAQSCPYYAPRLYMDMTRTGWPVDVITTDLSEEGRRKALEVGPYGRCVYHCDNDVVDHQVVNLLLEGGATVNFTMCAFTKECARQIRIMGTRAEIIGDMEKNTIEVLPFVGENQLIDVSTLTSDFSGHGGGDARMLEDLLDLVAGGCTGGALTNISRSVESHLVALAAEESRLCGGKSIEL